MATGSSKAALGTINQIVSGLPSDGYGRGSVAPVLPNAPSLFFRAGTENICEAVAELVIDSASPMPGAKRWSSAAPQRHFAAAVKDGESPSDALKSTFVVACLAPSSISVGL